MRARRDRRASDGRRLAGDLEAAVLEVLWAADAPLVPAEVRRALGDELAYSTVLTILARLHRKGVIARQPHGRGHAYRPIVAEADVVRDQVQQILRGATNRSVALQGFVAGLEPEDEAILRRLLDDASRPQAEER